GRLRQCCSHPTSRPARSAAVADGKHGCRQERSHRDVAEKRQGPGSWWAVPWQPAQRRALYPLGSSTPRRRGPSVGGILHGTAIPLGIAALLIVVTAGVLAVRARGRKRST